MVEARTLGGGGGGKGGERKFAKRWVHISFRFGESICAAWDV